MEQKELGFWGYFILKKNKSKKVVDNTFQNYQVKSKSGQVRLQCGCLNFAPWSGTTLHLKQLETQSQNEKAVFNLPLKLSLSAKPGMSGTTLLSAFPSGCPAFIQPMTQSRLGSGLSGGGLFKSYTQRLVEQKLESLSVVSALWPALSTVSLASHSKLSK